MDIFLIGTAWFWIITSALSVGLIASVITENGACIFLDLLVAVLFLQFGAHLHIFQYCFYHPIMILLIAVGYFVIGAIWMVAKWQFTVWGVARKYADLREDFIKEFPSVRDKYAGKTAEEAFAFKIGVVSHTTFGVQSIPPNPKEETSSLIYWTLYWPFSVLRTLLDEPITNLSKWIIRRCSGLMMLMSTRAFKDFTEIK